jgi:hypothetical protein
MRHTASFDQDIAAKPTIARRIIRKLIWYKRLAMAVCWRKLYSRTISIDDRVVSFDVFDTAIIRTWLSPEDQFGAIGDDLRSSGLFSNSDRAWAELRFAAEVEARRRSSREEIGFEEIYRVLAERLAWDPGQIGRAMEMEFARERRDIRRIGRTFLRIDELRKTAKDPVFLSDTYFSEAQIRNLLAECGEDLGRSMVLVSSAFGYTKFSGNLYPKVLASLNLKNTELIHIGDNPWSDGRSPARYRISSQVFLESQPTRYEQILATASLQDRQICSAVAGCARTARLYNAYDSPHSQAIWNTATNVAGPLLFAYVLWVLNRAEEQHIKRIFFFARDGDILVKIARMLCDWLGFSIECKYLYASRQSFCLASLTEVTKESLHWLVDPAESPSLRTLAGRVGLTMVQLANYQPVQEKEIDWDRPLSPDERNVVLDLFQMPEISRMILERALECRNLVLDYLHQEEMTAGIKFAVCDVGWRGLIQYSLEKIVAESPEFGSNFKGFYFGFNETELFVSRARAEAFTMDDTSAFRWLIDIFTATIHGSVKQFARHLDGTVAPVFSSLSDEENERWGVALQQEAILRFVHDLTTTLDCAKDSISRVIDLLKMRSFKALNCMLSDPAPDEAAAYGSIALAHGVSHDSHVEVAPALKLLDLARWIVWPRRSGLAWIYWTEATIRRSIRSDLLASAVRCTYHLRGVISKSLNVYS